MKFKLWTDHFTHVEGARYKGLSFVVEAPTVEQAIAMVADKVPVGARVVGYTEIHNDAP